MRWHRSLWLSSALLLLLPAVVPAQLSVVDPSNLAQNLITARRMVQQVTTAKQQLEYQIAALQSLKNPNWRHIGLLHEDLADVVREGEALGYSLQRLETEFDRSFPGYVVSRDIRAADVERTRRTLATMRATLRGAGIQARDAAAGQRTLGQIKAQMEGIEGTQAALELQATIQGLQADELGALRQQVASQANADAVYRAYEIQRRMQAAAAWDSLVATSRARRVELEYQEVEMRRRR